MINRIKRYIEEQNMFAEGDYVVAGVSGGADSICLLCVLLEISQDIPVTIFFSRDVFWTVRGMSFCILQRRQGRRTP